MKQTLTLRPDRKRDADIYYAPVHIAILHHMSRASRVACRLMEPKRYPVLKGKVMPR